MPINSICYKYPSIRYLTGLNQDKVNNIGQSYFPLRNFGCNRKALLYNHDDNTNPNQSTFGNQEMFVLDEPDVALNNNQGPLDNISSKGLLLSNEAIKEK